MTDNKRKEGPGGGQRGGQNKKNKGSHQGRWQTPHQKNKMANLAAMGNKVDAGDVGIWVTCQRKLEKKAMNEMISICDELCEKLYGIIPPTEEEKERYFSNKPTQDADKDSEDEDEDIEASIKKELEGMKPARGAAGAVKKKPLRTAFLPINLGCESVFFIRTHAPVDPVQLALAICEDARTCQRPRERKSRYINRLTPVSGTSKATETAVVSLSRDILGSVFKLRANEGTQQETPAPESQEGTEATETIASSTESAESSNPTTDKTAAKEEIPAYTYAIRTSKRNHNSLSTNTVVKSVAGQVSLPHKVNLTSPDKMVLIELFRNITGISVVEGADFERLRKFNLDSIYKLALDEAAASRKPADPGSVDASTPTPTEQEGADAMVSGGV
ncbi:hypothetical protein CFIMG_008116RA00001 [Ceratocystis fimbriata CBS 114723]|uniref:THUMP domain-containing protein n=1 Tax=Ceratocystis fimbriata CBS 114723 TaxID=1035309 RepID=A0A2C5X6L2_9PEZI|nr:hypothetical protein CFIMG_008116RA00001 [Ceratocystis fimbriata CBS 114723]